MDHPGEVAGYTGTNMGVQVRYRRTETTDWVASTTDTYFLTMPKAGSSRSRCLHDWVLVRTLFLICRQTPSRCVLTWRKERAIFLMSLLIRVLSPS